MPPICETLTVDRSADRRINLKGKITKCPAGRPAIRKGDPRLCRIFAQGTLRQKLPKPNRAILGILENTLSNRPETKKCPAGFTGAWTRRKIARPGTDRPAAIFDVIRGHNNKTPPEICTTTIVDMKLLILSNSFTHDRDQISSVKREKEWGALPTDP